MIESAGLAEGARRAAPLLCVFLFACLSSQSVSAPPQGSVPTYLWGIRKACRRDAYLSSAVEKRLFQMSGPGGGEYRRLLPRPLLENSTPKLAAAEFRRNCRFERTIAPQAGLLLGGRVEERGAAPPFTVMRLFRVDLATQEVFYRDHYCRGCDIARTLSTQAAFFLEDPGLPSATPEPGTTPTFCNTKSMPAFEPIPPIVDGERVGLSVRGADRKPRAGGNTSTKLLEALRQHVLATGRDVVPAGARYTITVELSANGGATVLLASRGGQGAQIFVAPPKAAPGAVAEGISESLVDRVVRAAGRLLDGMVDTELAATGQKPGPLYELPLAQATREVLCQPRTVAECSTSGSRGLDSDPSISQFFDPQCGELLEEEPPTRR